MDSTKDSKAEKYSQIARDGYTLYKMTGVAVALMDIVEEEAKDNFKLKYEFDRTIEPLFNLLID